MGEPPEEHVPIDEHMERNEPVCQSIHKMRRRHPEPIAREWLEIPDTKNDKPPTLLDYGEVGRPSKDIAADVTSVEHFDLLLLADDGTYCFWRPTYTGKKGKKQMLCEKMFEKKIYVTETVRVNRKGLPPSINKKQTNKNALVAVRSEQLLPISWMDRKQVRMPSTVVLVESTCHNESRKIPQIVADYNKGMGGGVG